MVFVDNSDKGKLALILFGLEKLKELITTNFFEDIKEFFDWISEEYDESEINC